MLQGFPPRHFLSVLHDKLQRLHALKAPFLFTVVDTVGVIVVNSSSCNSPFHFVLSREAAAAPHNSRQPTLIAIQIDVVRLIILWHVCTQAVCWARCGMHMSAAYVYAQVFAHAYTVTVCGYTGWQDLFLAIV